MCPPHCGDGGFDDRALLHWPAPDAALAEGILCGLAFVVAIAAALGVILCVAGLRAQVASLRRRQPVELDLSTLRGLWTIAAAAALSPAILGCLSALALSGEFKPLCMCDARWSDGFAFSRVAGLAGAFVPLALFLVMTKRADYRVVQEPDGRGVGDYRAALPFVRGFADLGRARRLVARSFALRLGPAATAVLVLAWPSISRGAPYTLHLFELTWTALAVLAFHFPTRAALCRPLELALRANR